MSMLSCLFDKALSLPTECMWCELSESSGVFSNELMKYLLFQPPLDSLNCPVVHAIEYATDIVVFS